MKTTQPLSGVNRLITDADDPAFVRSACFSECSSEVIIINYLDLSGTIIIPLLFTGIFIFLGKSFFIRKVIPTSLIATFIGFVILKLLDSEALRPEKFHWVLHLLYLQNVLILLVGARISFKKKEKLLIKGLISFGIVALFVIAGLRLLYT